MPPHVKSRQRVVDHGEVFTPPALVNDMLNLVAHECERIDSRFLEPACGNGNFLAEVLRRKLATVTKNNRKNPQRWQRDAILALSSLYGIDLLPDNIDECRERLLQILADTHLQTFHEPLHDLAHNAAHFILSRNILQGDALTFRTADGNPIVFSEWSPINGTLIKRTDFAYGKLVELADIASKPLPLFSDEGDIVHTPRPVADFPPTHYLKLADAEGTL
jgi:hypothetical protein